MADSRATLTENDAQLIKELKRNVDIKTSIRIKTLIYPCPQCYKEIKYKAQGWFIRSVRINKLCDRCSQRRTREKKKDQALASLLKII